MWEAASEVLAGHPALDFELLREADDIAVAKPPSLVLSSCRILWAVLGDIKSGSARCGSNQPFYQVTSLLLVLLAARAHEPSEGRVTDPRIPSPDLTGKPGDLTGGKLSQQGERRVPVGEPSIHLVPAVVVWRAQQPPRKAGCA